MPLNWSGQITIVRVCPLANFPYVFLLILFIKHIYKSCVFFIYCLGPVQIMTALPLSTHLNTHACIHNFFCIRCRHRHLLFFIAYIFTSFRLIYRMFVMVHLKLLCTCMRDAQLTHLYYFILLLCLPWFVKCLSICNLHSIERCAHRLCHTTRG